MRSAFFVLTIVLTTAVCHAQQKPAPPAGPAPAPMSSSASDRAAILADSEVRYTESGGVAGNMTTAVLKAGNGSTNVEYLPPQSRPATPVLTGTLTDAEYLELWKTLDSARVWSLKPAQKPAYPDMIRHELVVRIGTRSHQIVWLEADTSLATQTAITLAAAVRKSAEQAALLR
jgi:hypothetical protein